MSKISQTLSALMARAKDFHDLSEETLRIIERDAKKGEKTLELRLIPETKAMIIIEKTAPQDGISPHLGVVGSHLWNDATARVHAEALFNRLHVKTVPQTSTLPMEHSPYPAATSVYKPR